MRIAIIGTGYVGLVTGACLAKCGNRVICADLVQDRVDTINRGEAPFHEPELPELLRAVVQQGDLSATTSLAEALRESEISMITVGTPARDEGIDLSFVAAAAAEIGRLLASAAPYHVVVVKSTVVPGTTACLVRSRLEAASGLTLGQFGLCMNPEFLREGNAVADFMTPDRIVIGQSDPRAGERVARLYAPFRCPLVRTTLQNAEMVKYTSNALLATLISLSNEIAGLCEQTPGCDIDVVMDAVHLDRRLTPVVGNRRVQSGILAYLRAGSGYGGSCFPKDVYALRMFARELGMPVPLLDAVAKVNAERPRQVMSYLAPLLGPLQGQTIAVLGLAFKPETDDLRCSPALEIVALLQQAGAHVKAYDPVALAAATGLESPHFTLCSSPEQALAGADAAIIATAWPEIARWDWSALSAQMRRPCVIDVRNGFRQTPWPASVQYVPIGKALEPDDAHAQTLGECQAGS